MRILVLGLVILSGCILAPVMKGVQDAGITKNDRAVKLGENLREFKEALYWGQTLRLNSYLLEEGKESFTTAYKGVGRTERLTETKVEETEISEDGYSAKVRMMVRYYRIPHYTVVERVDTHDWKYEDGWKIASVAVGDEGNTSPLR